ncbi:hypothetical protein VTN77DRAFT_9920 [Rasamsonia byssochlamydoides]|uniref:uncharacterized protein n=1 Tax=Rasamsonia byssochlamydoides TaxID=89139 RepID=UPI0037436F9C
MPFTRGQFSPISIFPSFLVPSAPFHRRYQHSRPSSPARSKADSTTNDVREDKFLGDHVSYIRCARCAADICLTSQIISKGFTGRHGRAYLVSAAPIPGAIFMTPSSSPTTSLPNTITQRAVPRQLVTGAHTVCDISCVFCGSVLGWKYIAAEEESQRYKVGKFILETKRISTSSFWELEADAAASVPNNALQISEGTTYQALDGAVEFDSQDEEECEDLFAGVWTPALALRRRSRKFDNRHSEV